MRMMGYIPPVTHNQNSQYANKDVKNDYDPFRLKSINRILPMVSNQSFQQVSNGESVTKSLKRNRSKVEKSKGRKMVDSLYSELTGKGRNFDETV